MESKAPPMTQRARTMGTELEEAMSRQDFDIQEAIFSLSHLNLQAEEEAHVSWLTYPQEALS